MTEIYLRLIDLVLSPIIIMLAVSLFLRGHDYPGGGFIAGLTVAAAIELHILARGASSIERRIGRYLLPMIGLGLLFAVSAALIGIFGGGFFKGIWLKFCCRRDVHQDRHAAVVRPGRDAGRDRHDPHLSAALSERDRNDSELGRWLPVGGRAVCLRGLSDSAAWANQADSRAGIVEPWRQPGPVWDRRLTRGAPPFCPTKATWPRCWPPSPSPTLCRRR